MAKKKHDKGAGSTPATVQLEKAGVEFHVYEYEHSNDHMDDGYGVVGVVPVSGHMDLKALAAAAGAKKASMADPKVAMREFGYVVGGISPLGQKTHHKTVLDESALQFDQILVSGGKRGLSVGVNPQDLLKVLDAVAAPIGTW
ncbi:MAG: YbaK/EbsC family protein [Bifidobacterium breve]|nr:YbaK/EbsC family protein [Bifidobacterium breve]